MAIKFNHKTKSSLYSLEELSLALRRLSTAEAETLALLIDPEAINTIRQSLPQAKTGKLRELTL